MERHPTAIFDPDTNQCFPYENENVDFWFVSCTPNDDSIPEDGTIVTDLDDNDEATMKLPKRPDRRVFDTLAISAWIAVNSAPRSAWRWKQ